MASIESNVHGDVPREGAPPEPTVRTRKTPDGELIDAEYGGGPGVVRLQVAKTAGGRSQRAELAFSERAGGLLKVTGELRRNPQDKALGQATIWFQGSGVDRVVELDASGIIMPPNGAPPMGRTKVRTSVNGQAWDGEFDLRSRKLVASGRPAPAFALPERIRARIGPFRATLKDQVELYRKKSGGWFSPEAGSPPPGVVSPPASPEAVLPLASPEGDLCRASWNSLGAFAATALNIFR
jgi:hypothetical protein